MSTEKQTIAMIGIGMVAKTHLMAISDLAPNLCLAGVFARDFKKGEKFAKEAALVCGYPVKIYGNIDEVCSDPEVDIALILTPPNARVELVEKLAVAGKSILLEKPIERDGKAARRIVEFCETHGTPLGVIFQHRAREASVKLTELVQSGAFGRLSIAQAIVPWWREQSYYDEPGRGTYARDGGGVLISQAIHTLDLMLSLTGPVSEVQALASTTDLHTMEAEDYVTAGLRFSNGAVGSIIASTASFPGDAESITLHFEKAVTHLQSGELDIHWRNGKKENFGANASTGGGADPMAFTHAWHRDVIADFCYAVSNDRPALVSGREALQVHDLIDAIVASSTAGTVVRL